MVRNNRFSSIRMMINHVASCCVGVDKPEFLDNFSYFLTCQSWQLGQKLHLNLLYTDKFFRNLDIFC